MDFNSAVSSGLWGAPSSWVGGAIPTINDRVTILAGHNIVQNLPNAAAKKVIDKGQLIASRTVSNSLRIDATQGVYGGNLLLTEGGILDYGRGSDRIPAGITAKVDFRLTEANYTNTVGALGARPFSDNDVGLWGGINPTDSSQIHMHGVVRDAWTWLKATALKDQNQIVVDGRWTVGWSVGDELVITGTNLTTVDTIGTGANQHQYEVRFIAGITGQPGDATRTITLTANLSNSHLYEEKTWPSRFTGTFTEILTAEVANLTSNVSLASAAATDHPHVHIHGTCPTFVEDVLISGFSPNPTVFPMSRYGWHFHEMRDGSRGNYMRRVKLRGNANSGDGIHSHQSYGITYEDCVLYEQGNVFTQGLGLVGPGPFFFETTEDQFGQTTTQTHSGDDCRAVRCLVIGGGSSLSDTSTSYWMACGHNVVVVACHATGFKGTRSAAGFSWPGNMGGRGEDVHVSKLVSHSHTHIGVNKEQNRTHPQSEDNNDILAWRSGAHGEGEPKYVGDVVWYNLRSIGHGKQGFFHTTIQRSIVGGLIDGEDVPNAVGVQVGAYHFASDRDPATTISTYSDLVVRNVTKKFDFKPSPPPSGGGILHVMLNNWDWSDAGEDIDFDSGDDVPPVTSRVMVRRASGMVGGRPANFSLFRQSERQTAPTATVSGAGVLNGAYVFRYAYLEPAGPGQQGPREREMIFSAPSVTVNPVNQQVVLSGFAAAPTSTDKAAMKAASIRIYGKKGAGADKLVATVALPVTSYTVTTDEGSWTATTRIPVDTLDSFGGYRWDNDPLDTRDPTLEVKWITPADWSAQPAADGQGRRLVPLEVEVRDNVGVLLSGATVEFFEVTRRTANGIYDGPPIPLATGTTGANGRASYGGFDMNDHPDRYAVFQAEAEKAGFHEHFTLAHAVYKPLGVSAIEPVAPVIGTVTAPAVRTVIVNFTPAANALGHEVQFAPAAVGPWTTRGQAGPTDTNFTWTDVYPNEPFPNKTHFARVGSFGALGTRYWSASGSATTPLAVPRVPLNPRWVSVDHNSGTFRVTDDSGSPAGGDAETIFKGRYRPTPAGAWVNFADQAAQAGVGGTVDFATGDVLAALTEYEAEAWAENASGVGVKTTLAAGRVTTTEIPTPSEPGTPTIGTVTAVSQTRIDVAWTRNSPFTEVSFDIEARTPQGSGSYIARASSPAGATSGSWLEASPGTPYDVRATAVGPTGNRFASAAAQVTTLVALPSMPINLRAENVGQNTLDFVGVDNSGAGGDEETQFEARYQDETDPANPGGWVNLTNITGVAGTGSLITFSVIGLLANRVYRLVMRATNATGSSVGTSWNTGITVLTLPPDPPAFNPVSRTISIRFGPVSQRQGRYFRRMWPLVDPR